MDEDDEEYEFMQNQLEIQRKNLNKQKQSAESFIQMALLDKPETN